MYGLETNLSKQALLQILGTPLGTTKFLRADGTWVDVSDISVLTTLGDVSYGGAAGVDTRLAGNITAIKKFLNQTGTGAVSAAPTWAALVDADLPVVSVSKGGTGLSTLGDVAITNADSPYTAPATIKTIRANATSGAITINLPTAVGISGKEYYIFRTDITSSSYPIIVDGATTETIDSNLTYILWTGEWIRIISDGANWQVLDRPTPNPYGYYFLRGAGPNRRYVAANGGVSLTDSTTLPAVDLLSAFPFIVAKTTKFDTITWRYQTNATAGGVARAGIYRDSGQSIPGALMFDTGSTAVDAGAPAAKDTTITSSLQVFQPGLYWLVWMCGVAAPQIRCFSGPYNLYSFMQWDATLVTGNVSHGLSMAHPFGALPDPFSTTPTQLSGTPGVATPYPAIALRPI
jgi:hypothetical protein